MVYLFVSLTFCLTQDEAYAKISFNSIWIDRNYL